MSDNDPSSDIGFKAPANAGHDARTAAKHDLDGCPRRRAARPSGSAAVERSPPAGLHHEINAPARGSLCFTALDYLEWETGKLPEETDLAVIQSLTIKPYPGGKGVATGRGALPSHNSFVIEPQKAHRYDNELYRERELD
jgi:hypothetical protein